MSLRVRSEAHYSNHNKTHQSERWTGKMVHYLKTLAAKPEDQVGHLELTWRKERTDSNKLSSDLHNCIMTHAYTHIRMHGC